MIKVLLQYREKKTEFILKRIKYLGITNNNEYWLINRCLHYGIGKETESEYRENNSYICRTLIDEEPLSKTDEIFFVSHHYDIDDDSKMGTKSLVLRYLTKLVEDSVYSEELMQANSMLDVIAAIYSNKNYVFDNIGINQKTFSKILSLAALKGGYRANSQDFSYEETLMMQIDLLSKGSRSHKRTFVVIEIFVLTKTLKEFIDSIQNLFIIVVFMKSEKLAYSDNVFINNIDFENDESIYERMVEMTNYYDISTYKKHLKDEHLEKFFIK